MLCVLLFTCIVSLLHAQDQTTAVTSQDPSLPESDTAIASRQALKFADSLVKANFYTEWTVYMNLSCPSAIKYYGGKDAFKEHIVTMHYRDEPKAEEKPEKLHLETLVNDDQTWQCVIEKVRETYDDSHGKTKMISYLVGESTDNGLTWKFIDVSHNSLENFSYLLPTVFRSMPIPEGKTVYVDELAAKEAAQPLAKKKPVVKKQSR